MASRDSKLVPLHSVFSTRVLRCDDFIEQVPSDLVPGGATSPALAFKMYSKGSPLPSNKFYPGQFDEAPLGTLTTPKTKEEFFQAAKEAKFFADALLDDAKRREKEEAEAKAAEVQRKLDFAEKYMDDPRFSAQPPAAQPSA